MASTHFPCLQLFHLPVPELHPFIINQTLVNKMFLSSVRCCSTGIKPQKGTDTPIYYSQGVRSTGDKRGLRLASGGRGQVCRTEPLTCGL